MQIEINKIFTVKKGGEDKRWKVVNHPYHTDTLVLIGDYCGRRGEMSDKLRKEDYLHIECVVTLENAYKTAYSLC